MKKLFIAAALVLASTSAFAGVKTYQVTGPVLELSDKSILVEKGKEKWEIARDANTKLPDSVKVGSKVTIYYSMTAAEVEDKSPKSAEPAKDEKKDSKPADAKDPKAAADAKDAKTAKKDTKGADKKAK